MTLEHVIREHTIRKNDMATRPGDRAASSVVYLRIIFSTTQSPQRGDS